MSRGAPEAMHCSILSKPSYHVRKSLVAESVLSWTGHLSFLPLIQQATWLNKLVDLYRAKKQGLNSKLGYLEASTDSRIGKYLLVLVLWSCDFM